MLFKYGLLFAVICFGVELAKISQCPCKDLKKPEVTTPKNLDSTALPGCDCPEKASEPVCGSDGNTYNNVCLLECVRGTNPSLDVLKEGPCDMTDPTSLVPEDQLCDCSLGAESLKGMDLADCLNKGTECADINSQLLPKLSNTKIN